MRRIERLHIGHAVEKGAHRERPVRGLLDGHFGERGAERDVGKEMAGESYPREERGRHEQRTVRTESGAFHPIDVRWGEMMMGASLDTAANNVGIVCCGREHTETLFRECLLDQCAGRPQDAVRNHAARHRMLQRFSNGLHDARFGGADCGVVRKNIFYKGQFTLTRGSP